MKTKILSFLLVITSYGMASDQKNMVTCADQVLIEYRLQQNGMNFFCGGHLQKIAGKTITIETARAQLFEILDDIYAENVDKRKFKRFTLHMMQSRDATENPRQIKDDVRKSFINACIDSCETEQENKKRACVLKLLCSNSCL